MPRLKKGLCSLSSKLRATKHDSCFKLFSFRGSIVMSKRVLLTFPFNLLALSSRRRREKETKNNLVNQSRNSQNLNNQWNSCKSYRDLCENTKKKLFGVMVNEILTYKHKFLIANQNNVISVFAKDFIRTIFFPFIKVADFLFV